MKLIKKIKSFFKKQQLCQEIDYGVMKYEGRSGRSTRIIDSMVQDFFKNGECIVIDHWGTHKSNKRIFHITVSRLINEHGIKKNDLILDLSRCLIRGKSDV